MHRKSIRREVIEGEFETLLTQLRPTEGLYNFAFDVLRDLWDAKVASRRGDSFVLTKALKEIEHKVVQLLDRVVNAESDSLIKAYEKRIEELEVDKALMREKIAQCGKPIMGFRESYRTAFDFLANPCSLWHSRDLADRRAVLKLVFAEPLAYAKNEGYRTAEISMPFKVLGGLKSSENEMVRLAFVEPEAVHDLPGHRLSPWIARSVNGLSTSPARYGRTRVSPGAKPSQL